MESFPLEHCKYHLEANARARHGTRNLLYLCDVEAPPEVPAASFRDRIRAVRATSSTRAKTEAMGLLSTILADGPATVPVHPSLHAAAAPAIPPPAVGAPFQAIDVARLFIAILNSNGGVMQSGKLDWKWNVHALDPANNAVVTLDVNKTAEQYYLFIFLHVGDNALVRTSIESHVDFLKREFEVDVVQREGKVHAITKTFNNVEVAQAYLANLLFLAFIQGKPIVISSNEVEFQVQDLPADYPTPKMLLELQKNALQGLNKIRDHTIQALFIQPPTLPCLTNFAIKSQAFIAVIEPGTLKAVFKNGAPNQTQKRQIAKIATDANIDASALVFFKEILTIIWHKQDDLRTFALLVQKQFIATPYKIAYCLEFHFNSIVIENTYALLPMARSPAVIYVAKQLGIVPALLSVYLAT